MRAAAVLLLAAAGALAQHHDHADHAAGGHALPPVGDLIAQLFGGAAPAPEPPVPLSAGCGCVSSAAYAGQPAGCARHQWPLHPARFCYVEDPSACSDARPSWRFPGAAWRRCDEDAARGSSDVSGVVARERDLRVTREALKVHGLDATLAESGADITLLAPTDAAWRAAAAALGVPLRALIDDAETGAVLLQHVAVGTHNTSKIAAAGEAGGLVVLDTLSPQVFATADVTFRVPPPLATRLLAQSGAPVAAGTPVVDVLHPTYSPSPFSEGARVVAERQASNGHVLVIDAVLAPPASALDVARAEPSLGTFVRAVDVAGLGGALGDGCPNEAGVCIREDTGEQLRVSVLAPTDAAFESLAERANTTVAGLVADPSLAAVLRYHVSPEILCDANGSLMPPKNNSTGSAETDLQGLRLRLDDDGVFAPANGRAAAPSSARVVHVEPVYNGCLIVVDEVLLPPAGAP